MSSGAYLGGLFGLDGRVALVTGARQGIGEEIALALARAGADVAVTSRDVSALAAVCERIRETGAEALPLRLELGDAAEPSEAVAEVLRVFGRIDVVVNNAGLALHGDPLTYELEDWDRVFAVNLRGAFAVARTAAREMIERRSGRIINVSSTFARVGVRDRFAYAASKAGLEQLTRSLAIEWAPFGVTVNAVATTTVLTESRLQAFEDERRRDTRLAQIPLGRLGRPDDLAGAVLLLAGPAGSFVTGQTILVDGGYTTVRF